MTSSHPVSAPSSTAPAGSSASSASEVANPESARASRDAAPTTVDAIVIGGGAAGLSGALQLVRSLRSVVVVDAGHPRNASAHELHGFLGHDGIDPADLLARGRAEVTRYGARILSDTVDHVRRDDDGTFEVRCVSGVLLHARRLLVATGQRDTLPPVEHLAERFGRDVVHCPYCHGYEVRGRSIGVLATGPMAVHQALLFRQLSDDVTVLLHEQDGFGAESEALLAARGVPVVRGRAVRLLLEDDAIRGVELEDGRVVARDVLAVATRMHAPEDLLEELGIPARPHPSGMGAAVPASAVGASEAPGIWVAGNVTDLAAQVVTAAAQGAMAGAQINADLVLEEARAASGTTRG